MRCGEPAAHALAYAVSTAATGRALIHSPPRVRVCRCPLTQGVACLVTFWVVSPLAAALLAAALFLLLRTLVLRSRHAAARSFFVLPLFGFVTIFM